MQLGVPRSAETQKIFDRLKQIIRAYFRAKAFTQYNADDMRMRIRASNGHGAWEIKYIPSNSTDI